MMYELRLTKPQMLRRTGGVVFTIHRLLAPSLKKKQSYTYNPLWAFMACYRIDLTFTLKNVKDILELFYSKC